MTATGDSDRTSRNNDASSSGTGATSRPNSYKARNYELDLEDVEIGDLPDGWHAASDNIAVSMFGDSPAIKLARKGVTEVDLDGLFEQSGSFSFSFTAGVSDGSQHGLRVILVDEKGLELKICVTLNRSGGKGNVRSKFDDAEKIETVDYNKTTRTFVVNRKDAKKGIFNFIEEGFDSQVVAVKKPEFGTLVSARIIMDDPQVAISDVRVAAQKSSSVLERQDLKQRYVLDIEEADIGDWPDEWSGSNGMLISNLGNIKVLRPNSGNADQNAEYTKLGIKGNFSLSYTLVAGDGSQHNTNIIIKDNQGKQISLPVTVNKSGGFGDWAYGFDQPVINSSYDAWGDGMNVASFNLTRKGNVFTLVMTGEYTNKATLNVPFGELKSVTFQSNSSEVGLSALKVIKLVD
ncbi:MAG: hypothetical protein IJU03_13175 [Thermoguttaceae bacterium]|nr:hypothetical protein [Thermoguttaceae bacterium]